MRVWRRTGWWMGLVLCGALRAQTPATKAVPTPLPMPPVPAVTGPAVAEPAKSDAAPTPAAHAVPNAMPPGAQGVALDRVVAVVNGDLVLESDVDEERRFAAFQPVRDPSGTFSREQAIERLIDRRLILQQANLQAEAPISDTAVNAEILTLRKEIPACKEYQCETDAGWQRFLKDHGFTEEELTARWRERMEVLRYIEMRFRMGIDILPADIKTYYEKTMLPVYAKENVPAPKLEAVSGRIQEVLLQQRVSSLLVDWLKSLRAQGSVLMMKPGEMTP